MSFFHQKAEKSIKNVSLFNSVLPSTEGAFFRPFFYEVILSYGKL